MKIIKPTPYLTTIELEHRVSCRIDSSAYEHGVANSTIESYKRTLRGGYFITELGRFDQGDVEIVLSPVNSTNRFCEALWIAPYMNYFIGIGCLSKRADSKNKVK